MAKHLMSLLFTGFTSPPYISNISIHQISLRICVQVIELPERCLNWLEKLFPELTENRARPSVLATDLVHDQIRLLGGGKTRQEYSFEKWTPIANEAIGFMLKKVRFLKI